jgi:hypothetical protein
MFRLCCLFSSGSSPANLLREVLAISTFLTESNTGYELCEAPTATVFLQS